MLIHELLPLIGNPIAVVQAGTRAGLSDLLRIAPEIPFRAYDAEAEKPFDDGTVLVAFLGPDDDPEADVAAALRLLPVGGTAVLLFGWPIEDLPYHRLLGPMVDASVQAIQAVPVDKVSRHGVHVAVIAARVDRLAPLRTHLDESPIALTGAEPELATLLRVAGEHLFGELVSRPARRNLVAFRDDNAALRQQVKELERTSTKRIETLEKQLATARADLEKLRASATFEVGRTVLNGARRPVQGIVAVPVGLAKVWRRRRGTNGVAAEPQDPTG